MTYASDADLQAEAKARQAADAELDGRLDAVELQLGITPPVVPPTQPPVVPPVTTTGAYGTGLSGDSRSNHQIGWTNRARLAYRFRSLGGTITSLRVQERGGPSHDKPTVYGYSWGNGGKIRATVQADANGVPSGTPLASVEWAPGNDGWTAANPAAATAWEVWTLHTFPTPVALPAGLYHLVFENVAADPVGNYISLNVLYTMGSVPTPRQAAFSDDFAVLYATTGAYQLQASDVPIFDLAYADGHHDGSAYIGTLADRFGLINGSANMVRELFKVSGSNRTVGKAHVRVKRISGTGSLVMALVNANGTVIASGSVPATQIAVGAAPPGNLSGDTWAHATFAAPATLTAGQAYSLRLSTDGATTYTAVPLQQGTSKGLLSRVFGDGDGQRTTDGGANWANLYPYDSVDLQFWLD